MEPGIPNEWLVVLFVRTGRTGGEEVDACALSLRIGLPNGDGREAKVLAHALGMCAEAIRQPQLAGSFVRPAAGPMERIPNAEDGTLPLRRIVRTETRGERKDSFHRLQDTSTPARRL